MPPGATTNTTARTVRSVLITEDGQTHVWMSRDDGDVCLLTTTDEDPAAPCEPLHHTPTP